MISDKLLKACKGMVDKIYDQYGILPFVYNGPTAIQEEEGVIWNIRYNSSKEYWNGYSLIMEVYDDGEIAAIIADNNNKVVVYSEGILDFKVDNIFSYFVNLPRT